MKGCTCATTDCLRSTVAETNAAEWSAFWGTVWTSSVVNFESASQHGSPVWMSPDMPPVGPERHRAETRHIALLTVIRRIVAAIRRWREHARSQQQLRAFDDRLLRDIGLRREDLGYGFPKPFRHWD